MNGESKATCRDQPRYLADNSRSRRTGKPARYFKDFRWTTRRSWSRERRVIAKAEFTKGEAKSALRCHLAEARRVQAQIPLLEDLLRPRRHGEPDQGVPARSLCRSHLDGDDATQPAPPLVRFDGLRAALRLAADRAASHALSTQAAVPFVSSFSGLALSYASVSAASKLRWYRAVLQSVPGAARPSVSSPPQPRAARPPDTRRRNA
jgi:hypothetical protein